MNQSTQAMTRAGPWMGDPVVMSSQGHQLVALGRDRGWHFKVLGRAPMPTEPVRFGTDWLIVPADQNISSVPARTLDRVRAIYEAGIRPRGFLVVHEISEQLPAPPHKSSRLLPMRTASPQMQSMLKVAGTALGAAGTVVVVAGGVVLSAAALALSAALAVPVLLVAGAVAAIDPILVVVTEDLVWIECDRWWD